MKKLRDELKEAVDKNDMDGLKVKLDALEQAANKMAEQMYAQAQPGGEAAQNASTAAGKDDVVDADFKEKK